MFGAAAPAGAATSSFTLTSASQPGQSSVTWQGPPLTGTPNVFPDATNPVSLSGQIDPSTGDISGATLYLPPLPQPVQDGEATTFTFTEVHPGTATGNFNSTTGAVTLNDSLTLTFTGTGPITPTCVSTPINVSLSGTWNATTQDVTLATTSSFTIPQFPMTSSCPSVVLNGPNGNDGINQGVPGSVGNAMSLALNGRFAPGAPTTTSLAVSPNSPVLQGTSVTLTATVAPTSGTTIPTGSVNFLDNGASLGTSALDNTGTATFSTSTLPAGASQQLTAQYTGDPNFAPSTSSATSYTVTPLPAVAADLPGSITVPTATAAPAVTGVSPDGGPPAGGTKVTIAGSGFIAASTVHFGSALATNVTYVNSQTITATSPAGTGVVDVAVTTGNGTSPTSVADTFAYSAPTVTGVSPNAGPANTYLHPVTITGTGFVPSATVNFGSIAATRVNVLSSTSMQLYSPPEPVGTVDVTVTTPGGTSATSAADQFTFNNGPAVTDLRTPSGPAAGGTSVEIDGYNLTGATAVDFGTAAATITATTATTITVKSPAGTSGSTVDVTVTTSSGTSTTWAGDQFTYGPPTVTGVSPSGGSAAGGTPVTITGTGFAASTYTASDSARVYFGTTAVSTANTTINGLTSITAIAPAGTGTVNVTVKTTSGGTSATSPADQFTYGPTVTGVSPPSGPTAGNTSVTITGTGFTGATAVTFGANAASSFTVGSDTSITATSPKGSAGAADVTVTTPDGTSPTSAADQFFYGASQITSIAPNAGPTTGGTTVTITGQGFSGTSAVVFGTTPATSFTVVSPTQLTAVSPGGAAGRANIKVTTPGGTSGAATFTYSTAPSVASVSPNTGPSSGATSVTISGANFTGANAVTFGSTPAASYTVVNDTTITAKAPPGSSSVDVTVASANGTSATGPGDVFSYGVPTVTGVAPNVGSTAGGDTVVVTGTGFASGTTVSFGSVPASSVTIISPTQLSAVSPPEGAGAVDITVTNGGGTSATSATDTYTYSAGADPGQASLTITNPSAGQAWNNLYLQIVLSGVKGLQHSGMTVSYQDASGDWCPLAPTVLGSQFTFYFSGAGTSCAGAPGSFSLEPGQSLVLPLQLNDPSDAYLGTQNVAATLYSGSCSSPTSCAQSGDLDGTVEGVGTTQLVTAGRLATQIESSSGNSGNTNINPMPQGFTAPVPNFVYPTVTSTTIPAPTGTVEYLLDGSPATLLGNGGIGTTVANPTPLTNQSSQGYSDTSGGYINTLTLAPGVHTLTSVYSGDYRYAPATLNQTFTVLPPPTGTLFSCQESILSGAFGIINGFAYVTASSPPVAATTSGTSAQLSGASVAINGDPNLLTTGIIAFANYPTSLSLSPGGSLSGVATASSDDTLASWSNLSGAVPVSGAVGSSVPVGVDEIFVSYFDTISNSNDTTTCTPVSDPAPLASVPIAGNTLAVSPSGSAVPGAAVTLTDTVNLANLTPNGQVTFYDGSNVLGTVPVDYSGGPATGTATLSTGALALGDHQLSAVWSGNGNVPQNTSNTVEYQVGTSSTTTLTSSANPANAANAVTFTATVNGASGSPQPTGDVSFTVDGNAPAACQNVGLSTASPPTATCKLSLKAGTTHSVVATYSGDATYIGSSSDSLSQSMLPATTSTLTTAKNPAPAGNVTFWDGVSASGGGTVPTGTVAFTVDSKPYAACAHQPLGSGGGASCTLSFKAGTAHKVYATYAGSSSYSGSTSNTISLKVSGAGSSTKPQATGGSATLASGKTLTANQSIATGSYKLVMQPDGNLVEYQGSKARWASGTSGHSGTKVTMQTDGNLVEYQGGRAIWASGTSGHPGAHLTLQASDGNVVIYTPAGNAVWSTGT